MFAKASLDVYQNLLSMIKESASRITLVLYITGIMRMRNILKENDYKLNIHVYRGCQKINKHLIFPLWALCSIYGDEIYNVVANMTTFYAIKSYMSYCFKFQLIVFKSFNVEAANLNCRVSEIGQSRKTIVKFFPFETLCQMIEAAHNIFKNFKIQIGIVLKGLFLDFYTFT